MMTDNLKEFQALTKRVQRNNAAFMFGSAIGVVIPLATNTFANHQTVFIHNIVNMVLVGILFVQMYKQRPSAYPMAVSIYTLIFIARIVDFILFTAKVYVDQCDPSVGSDMCDAMYKFGVLLRALVPFWTGYILFSCNKLNKLNKSDSTLRTREI
jgi:hypothetical protein